MINADVRDVKKTALNWLKTARISEISNKIRRLERCLPAYSLVLKKAYFFRTKTGEDTQEEL
jgi:hypothetical protein